MARELILSREQFYLDQIFSADDPNTYNILEVAGSSLGCSNSTEAKAKVKPCQVRIIFILVKLVSLKTKSKISATLGTKINVFDTQGTLVNSFNSARKAAEYFNSYHTTIMSYLKNNKLFQDKWY